MEDAKITQGNEQNKLYQQERFPSVITTDDLVFELGKNVVDKLNKEKLLEGLLRKKQNIEAQIVDTEKIKADCKKQVSVLEDSNQRYEKNNRDLGDELVRIRQDLTNKTNENIQLKSSFDTEKIQLSAFFATEKFQLVERYEDMLKELNEKFEDKKAKKDHKKKNV